MTDAADLGNARVVVIRVCDRADPIPAELSTFREFSKRRNEELNQFAGRMDDFFESFE